jgi:hypothetical protein
LLSLKNSLSERVDNEQIKIVTLYPLPEITGLNLHARAHFANGTYPSYPELEFVTVTIENSNNVDMQKIPVRCRTNRLKVDLNATWIDRTTLV